MSRKLKLVYYLGAFLLTYYHASIVVADDRDEAIFGADAPTTASQNGTANQGKSSVSPEKSDSGQNPEHSLLKGLAYDQISVGARIDLQSEAQKIEHQSYSRSQAVNQRFFDIYFNGNLPQQSRALLKLRFNDNPAQTNPTNQQTSSTATNSTPSQQSPSMQIDEAWLRTKSSGWFLTIGKQHLRWGSSHFWNPTDFLAAEARDPFQEFDQRLGLYMVKTHFPVESLNHNYYLVLSYHDVQYVSEAKLAARAEWALNKNAETSLTYAVTEGGKQGLGIDISSGLGDFDLNLEAAFEKHPKQTIYQGRFDPDTLELPSKLADDNKWWFLGVTGLNFTKNYFETDSVIVGLEYFYNQLGYQERDLELYAMLQGQNQPLKLAQHYWGAYVRLPEPLSLNNSTIVLSAIENQDDQTATVRLSHIWTIMQGLSLETYLSHCFGESGELCFSLPAKYRTALEHAQTTTANSTTNNPVSSLNTATLLSPKRESSIGLHLVAEF